MRWEKFNLESKPSEAGTLLRGRRARSGCAVGIAALLLALFLGACSSQEETAPVPERYARRFMLPESGPWQLESNVPQEPQKAPKMVIWEVSQYPPDTEPTPVQREAAADLVERCERAALQNGWEDKAKGLADGFTKVPHDRSHYYNEQFVMDDRILDPDRPEFLMYRGKLLVGFMFYVRTRMERGPQIGGPLTVWHYHNWNHTGCLLRGMVPVGRPAIRGRCPKRLLPSYRSPEMLHVWLIDRPRGPFTTDMAVRPSFLMDAKRDLSRRRRNPKDS